MITPPTDGLGEPWEGRVWLHPPYGPETWMWLARLAEHKSGIALIFARTETRGFVAQVWGKARALLFLHGRLHFHHPITGERAKANAGGPSILIAYSSDDAVRLARSNIPGSVMLGWRNIPAESNHDRL